MILNITVSQKPTAKEQEVGTPEKLVIGQTQVVAENVNSGVLALGVANAAKLKDADLTRLNVVIQQVG